MVTNGILQVIGERLHGLRDIELGRVVADGISFTFECLLPLLLYRVVEDDIIIAIYCLHPTKSIIWYFPRYAV